MKIRIVSANESVTNSIGIYRIWFGQKFYLGSAKDIFSRMKSHESAINQGFDAFLPKGTSLRNIIVHLKSQPSITEATFEVVRVCQTETDLVDAEFEWLSAYKGDPNCLNHSFTSTRKINGVMVYPKPIPSIIGI